MVEGANFLLFIAQEFIIGCIGALARVYFVVERVEQVLHQVVTFLALSAIRTFCKSFIHLDIHAPLRTIEEVLRRSSEILEAMRVVAHRPVVLFFYLGTKRRFVTVDHELVNCELFLQLVKI